MAGFVKSLATELSVPQIIWGRYFFHILLIVVVFPLKIPTILVSGRRKLQILRGVLVLCATTCAFTALQYIPMANVAAIGFVGPSLVVGMAAVLLHERVGVGRWVNVSRLDLVYVGAECCLEHVCEPANTSEHARYNQ